MVLFIFAYPVHSTQQLLDKYLLRERYLQMHTFLRIRLDPHMEATKRSSHFMLREWETSEGFKKEVI